jgi:opacity protein-like surface antigen
MKKLLIAAFAAAVLTGGAFAKTWTNNIGVGFTLPISTVGAKDKTVNGQNFDFGDLKQIGYGVEGTYIGVHENGFTAKADVSVGVATSKDVQLQDESTNLGVFENVYIGAGYSFINSEKALLGLTAMLGVNCSQYKSKETISGWDYDNTFTLASFGVGGDIFGLYRFKPNFGMFANVGIRYLVVGGVKYEREVTKNNTTTTSSFDFDASGKLSIQPTIGVIWTF